MAVIQRGKYWHLDLTRDGRRYRKAIKEAQTRKQAEHAERVFLNELFEKRYGEKGQRRFADFVENSYKPYAEDKRSYRTELVFIKTLIEHFGKMKLSEITPEKIEEFKRQRAGTITRRKTIRSKSSVNKELFCLSAIFTLAKNFGEIRENPVSRVKNYADSPNKRRAITESEENLIFESLKSNPRLYTKAVILLYTGMRSGELFKLEWRDLDLENGFINLRAETTKMLEARTIPMFSNVKAIFEKMRDELPNVNKDEKVIICGKSENTYLSMQFTKHCRNLGICDVSLHCLRHTFSTRANQNGIDVFTQKAWLGHKNLSMTDRYTHIEKEASKANLEQFERSLRQKKDTKRKKSSE